MLQQVIEYYSIMDNIDRLYNNNFLDYDKQDISSINIFNLKQRIFIRLLKTTLTVVFFVLLISILPYSFTFLFVDTDSLLIASIVTVVMLIFIVFVAIKLYPALIRLGQQLEGSLSRYATISISRDGLNYQGVFYPWDVVEFTSDFEKRNIENINNNMISNISKNSTYLKENIIIFADGARVELVPKSTYEYNKLIEGILYFYFYKKLNKKF